MIRVEVLIVINYSWNLIIRLLVQLKKNILIKYIIVEKNILILINCLLFALDT